MRKKQEPVETVPCAWRTGAKHCLMYPTGRYCSWHSYWFKLVERGNLGRQQKEEFADWWEQFQPYGKYATLHGQWWADKELLWSAIAGEADLPTITEEIRQELYVRRVEVARCRAGVPWPGDPWPRLSGSPLPSWNEEEWKKKVDGSFHNTKQCG